MGVNSTRRTVGQVSGNSFQNQRSELHILACLPDAYLHVPGHDGLCLDEQLVCKS